MIKIWVIVRTFRGLLIEPEIYYSRKEAVLRKRELIKEVNPQYDEIEIFNKIIE